MYTSNYHKNPDIKMGGTAGTNILDKIVVIIKCTGGCYNSLSPRGVFRFLVLSFLFGRLGASFVRLINPRYIGYFGFFRNP